jgi:hypothetical protein
MDTLRTYLRVTEEAMKAEGIGDRQRKRVIDRLTWGHPCSGKAPGCRFTKGPDGWACHCGEVREDAAELLARLGPDPEWLEQDREQQVRQRAEEMLEPYRRGEHAPERITVDRDVFNKDGAFIRTDQVMPDTGSMVASAGRALPGPGQRRSGGPARDLLLQHLPGP